MKYISKLFFNKGSFRTTVMILLFLFAYFGLYLLYRIFSGPDRNQVSYSDNNLQVLDLSIPSKLDFCGEEIPKDDYKIRTALAKEFLNKEYWKSNSKLLFSKAQRWFPYIEPILKQEGVPDDFKYVAVIESHLSNVRSAAGAAGYWQLVEASANVYGLEVSRTVDERLHVEKSTKAACKLIKEAFAVFRNWTLTAAAYNRGINGLLKAMKDQNSKNYHQLLLNPETGSFVYRILAYKTLLSDPGHFGIQKRNLRHYPKIPYKTVKIDSSIVDLDRFSRALGWDPVQIRGHNPWLIADGLDNPQRKVYELRIPKNVKADYSNYFSDLIPGYPLNEDLPVADSNSIITSAVQGTVFIEAETKLDEIAKHFGTGVNELKKWNKLPEQQSTVKSQSLFVKEPGNTEKSK